MTMMRSSASESDLIGRQHTHTHSGGGGSSSGGGGGGLGRMRSPSFDTLGGGASSQLPPSSSSYRYRQSPSYLSGGVHEAGMRRARQQQQRQRRQYQAGLHTALRGLLAVYDCASPQLMQLANEISESAEMWDSLLYRPHRLVMVRLLNLRSFKGDKQPTERLGELREALGQVAMLLGALQTFVAELHTAARACRAPHGIAPPEMMRATC
jgi:hypothetical protein